MQSAECRVQSAEFRVEENKKTAKMQTKHCKLTVFLFFLKN